MRLTSHKSFPTNFSSVLNLKLNKIKSNSSNKQFKQLPQYLTDTLSKNNSIFPEPIDRQQQILQIEEFVEQFRLDPNLLSKLVDYKQLINNVKNQQFEILQKINGRKKQCMDYRSVIENQKNQNQQSTMGRIRKDQQLVESEINNYISLYNYLIQQKTQKQLINNQKVTILTQHIKQQRHKFKNQIQTKLKQKNEYQNKNLTLCTQIKIIQQKISQKQLRLTQIKDRKQNNKVLQKKLLNTKNHLNQLKKKQVYEIEKQKAQISYNSKKETQFKKSTEKKLNKFIKQLIKILQKSDQKGLESFALGYQNNCQFTSIRNKNTSEITKPDENDDNEDQRNMSEQKDFQNLVLDSNLLKQYQSMNIKRLQETQFADSKDAKVKNQKIERMQKQHKTIMAGIEQRMNKVTSQQQEADMLISALQQKIKRINVQI